MEEFKRMINYIMDNEVMTAHAFITEFPIISSPTNDTFYGVHIDAGTGIYTLTMFYNGDDATKRHEVSINKQIKNK